MADCADMALKKVKKTLTGIGIACGMMLVDALYHSSNAVVVTNCKVLPG